MTRFKIIRADGVTELAPIKSFHFHSQCTTDGSFRFGNSVADYIEVVFFGTYSDAIPVGETLTCYQVVDVWKDFTPVTTPRQLKIGYFTVTSSMPGKNTCKFIAFDSLVKLDVDYSARLKELEPQFPMTYRDLLDDVANYVGVNCDFWNYGQADFLRTGSVNKFYMNNITARDLIGFAAELRGCNLKATNTADGTIALTQYGTFSGNTVWDGSNLYVIAPTDTVTYYDPITTQALNSAFYRENGLTIEDSAINNFDSVIIRKADGTVLDEYKPNGTADNPFYVQGNPLLDYTAVTDPTYIRGVSSMIYAEIQTYKPYTANLFTFRCPYYQAGCVTFLVDKDGTVIKVPIMSIDWTDSGVVLEGFKPSTAQYSDYESQTLTNKNATLEMALNELANQVSGKASADGSNITNASTWRTNLGLGVVATEDVVPIAKGGTGATSASSALSNLGGLPLVVIDSMTANTASALTTALTTSNSSIPVGISILQCGNSSNVNRALVLCIKLNQNLGRGYVVSAYAINASTVTLGTGGTWS